MSQAKLSIGDPVFVRPVGTGAVRRALIVEVFEKSARVEYVDDGSFELVSRRKITPKGSGQLRLAPSTARTAPFAGSRPVRRNRAARQTAQRALSSDGDAAIGRCHRPSRSASVIRDFRSGDSEVSITGLFDDTKITVRREPDQDHGARIVISDANDMGEANIYLTESGARQMATALIGLCDVRKVPQ